MATSRRREIIDFLVSNLRFIEGQATGFIVIATELGEDLLTEDNYLITTEDESGYVFHNNLYKNVYKGLKFLDQINDFPSIYLQAGQEVYNYESKGSTTASLEIMLRVYAYTEGSITVLEDMVEDVTRIVERIDYTQNDRIIDCLILSVDTDGGLLDPYGLAEIKLNVLYDVED